LARLSVGDRVRFADTAKPQYLRGATGEIHEFYEDLVVVCLDTHVGKFRSGHVRTSPAARTSWGDVNGCSTNGGCPAGIMPSRGAFSPSMPFETAAT
ncbi:MAG: hypothetical protein ACRDWN_06975, partial [Acidimicrobiales bacterium]